MTGKLHYTGGRHKLKPGFLLDTQREFDDKVLWHGELDDGADIRIIILAILLGGAAVVAVFGLAVWGVIALLRAVFGG